MSLPPATWAGAYTPLPDHHAVGTEDGQLLIVNHRMETILTLQGSVAGEAVNGAAFFGPVIAISTRADLNLIRLRPQQGAKFDRVTVPVGCHSVEVTREGLFVAPAGAGGVVYARWDLQTNQVEPILAGASARAGYFYRAAVLNGPDAAQAVLFALRRGGIGRSRILGPHLHLGLKTMHSPRFDVVDVCTLGSGSFAAVALMRDGSLLVLPDARDFQRAQFMQMTHPAGVAYRVHSQDGHVFVLTERKLIYLHDAARNVLAGGFPVAPFAARLADMRATDLSYHSEEQLQLVLADGSLHLFPFASVADETARLLGTGGGDDFECEQVQMTEESCDLQAISLTV